MESLNETIKKTLHFIAVIQDACDKRRLKIEMHNSQGYDKFVKEWKTEKSTNPPKKSDIVLVETLQDEAAILEEDMEELALVDNLLEKARNIRLKNKNISKKDETKRSLNGIQVSNNTSKSKSVESQRQKTSFKKNDDPSFNKRPVPRSKSACISSKLKTSVVPRSKSANVQHIMNGDENGHRFCRTSAKPTSKNGRTVNASSQNEHTMNNGQNTVVLSSTELNEFKNIGSSQNFRKKKSPFSVQSGEKVNLFLNSDLKQCPEKQTIFPTYRKFFQESQRLSILKSSARMQICGVWYPFLSLKSKKYLVEQPNLVPLNSFTKALKLIHQIQETMLWIDLLSLIGRNAIPNLHLLDDSDWSAIRLCSFLESIYSENLQRTPILDSS